MKKLIERYLELEFEVEKDNEELEYHKEEVERAEKKLYRIIKNLEELFEIKTDSKILSLLNELREIESLLYKESSSIEIEEKELEFDWDIIAKDRRERNVWRRVR